jgi:osmotically inducible lipoprotein OsmB
MKKSLPIILGSALLITGCSNMDSTQQRTLSGGAIGATAGAVGAAIFHSNPIWGAVGGAAVGAASGYVYDLYEKDKQAEYNKGYQAGKSGSKNTNSSSSSSK